MSKMPRVLKIMSCTFTVFSKYMYHDTENCLSISIDVKFEVEDFLLLFSKLTPITIHHENSGTRINCQEKDRNLHDFANQG